MMQSGEYQVLLESLSDVFATLRRTDLLPEVAVFREQSDLIELKRGQQHVLVVTPVLWQDENAIESALSSCADATPALVCVGSEVELPALAHLRHRVLLASLQLPTTVREVAACVQHAFALLEMQHRAAEQEHEAQRYRGEIQELITIAAALNSEHDITRLLSLILEKCRQVTNADAGSVYIVAADPTQRDKQRIRFEVAQNDSVHVDLKSFTLPVDSRSIVGASVVSGRILNVADLALSTASARVGFSHNRSIDLKTGYQTRSVLTVPMINLRDEVIGVVQLINKKIDGADRLSTASDFDSLVIPFDARAVELCKTLAYQASIALDNALLYDELRQVFEGFVEASVLAIESRDPTTSGHSRRVADLTVNLAKAVDRCSDGPYAGLRFSSDEIKEIEYAGLMHDFGKVGVPENVLLKEFKLYDWQLQQILARFDFIRLQLRTQMLQQQLKLALAAQRQPPAEFFQLEQGLADQLERIDQFVAIIQQANQPTVLDSQVDAQLAHIAENYYLDAAGQLQPYLTQTELASLKIMRGSLDPYERSQIESHVAHSYRFLCTIPWGRSLRRIPLIAGDHHEKLDGTGYPNRKRSDTIPVQAKMMTIADIYDALTAADRPYKRALSAEKALSIIDEEVRSGKLDGALVASFIEAGVYINSTKAIA